MGAMSRTKGRTAEREAELIFQSYGLQTDRNIGGREQVSGDISVRFAPQPFAVEVRRREKPAVPTWMAEHEASTPDGQLPLLVWRRNRETWRATLDLQRFLELVTRDNPVRW